MQGASFTSAREEMPHEQVAREPACRIEVRAEASGFGTWTVRIITALLLLTL